MEKKAKDAILNIFYKNNNLVAGSLENKLQIVVAETYAPYLLFIECLDSPRFKCSENPIDGLFVSMIHRLGNTLGSMVSLISSGHLQDAEIVSRTVSETAITIQYLLAGKTSDNVANYLASYILGQERKNDLWRQSIDGTDYDDHVDLVKNKNSIERSVIPILKQFIAQSGGNWPTKPNHPNVSQIFASLNKDVEYRTVYRAMCGQSHQNSED